MSLTKEQVEMSREWLLEEAGTSSDKRKAANDLCDLAVRGLELERRIRVMAGSNSDDYRWFKNAVQQAIRSLDTAIG